MSLHFQENPSQRSRHRACFPCPWSRTTFDLNQAVSDRDDYVDYTTAPRWGRQTLAIAEPRTAIKDCMTTRKTTRTYIVYIYIGPWKTRPVSWHWGHIVYKAASSSHKPQKPHNNNCVTVLLRLWFWLERKKMLIDMCTQSVSNICKDKTPTGTHVKHGPERER